MFWSALGQTNLLIRRESGCYVNCYMPAPEHSLWLWSGFAAFVVLMLSLDLGLFNRRAHRVTFREASIWSVVWIALAAGFAGVVFWRMGSQRGMEFTAGYLIELSLSVDNLFIFILIFSYFKLPEDLERRVLFWGVIGALVMRLTMILAGAALLERFHWISYIFGAFLVYTGLRMLREDETDVHPEANPLVRIVTRYVPVSRAYHGSSFFTSEGGRRVGTLLLLVVVIVEVTDLIFALDSIPAIFAVTEVRFILYTSNVFAIMGLRSFYFLLAGVVDRFHYLSIGLSIVLTFIGLKMLLVAVGIVISIHIALAVVIIVLSGSVLCSLIWPPRAGADAVTAAAREPAATPEPVDRQ